LHTCQRIFDTSYSDLHVRHGIPIDEDDDDPDWLHPILIHFMKTDPQATLLATVDDEPVAIASTVRRDDYWFLSFLFVLPGSQAQGIGRALLDRLGPSDPGVVRATIVESFQPVSTALYASYGMTPRAINYWLGKVSRPHALSRLPSDLLQGPISSADADEIDALDRTMLGFDRRVDHNWWSEEGAVGWAYRRGGDLVAYAYVENGVVAPALATDERTLCEVVGDVVGTADEPASMSVHVGGNCSAVFRMLIEAGARIDDGSSNRFIYCSSDGPLPASYIFHAPWLP
jgi:GNAT superfamily N-acetyltransferase